MHAVILFFCTRSANAAVPSGRSCLLSTIRAPTENVTSNSKMPRRSENGRMLSTLSLMFHSNPLWGSVAVSQSSHLTSMPHCTMFFTISQLTHQAVLANGVGFHYFGASKFGHNHPSSVPVVSTVRSVQSEILRVDWTFFENSVTFGVAEAFLHLVVCYISK